MQRYALLTLGLILWWLAVAGVYLEQSLSMTVAARPDLGRTQIVVASVTGWLVWVPLSLLAIAIINRYRFGRGGLGPAFVAVIVFALVSILVRAIFVHAANDVVSFWYPLRPPFGQILIDSVRNNIVLALMVFGVAHSIHYARADADSRLRIAALDAELTHARLDALAAQLKPHFLFNTLNVIAETVHHDPQKADAMIVNLSQLLRSSLDAQGRQLIPLDEELRMLDDYLALQAMRYGDRLKRQRSVDDGVMNALVPPFLFQPLVENAIVHGIATLAEGGQIDLSICSKEDRLFIVISNPGVFEPNNRAGAGVGLSAIRSRLTTLFGRDWELTLQAGPDGIVCATIMIPLTYATCA